MDRKVSPGAEIDNELKKDNLKTNVKKPEKTPKTKETKRSVIQKVNKLLDEINSHYNKLTKYNSLNTVKTFDIWSFLLDKSNACRSIDAIVLACKNEFLSFKKEIDKISKELLKANAPLYKNNGHNSIQKISTSIQKIRESTQEIARIIHSSKSNEKKHDWSVIYKKAAEMTLLEKIEKINSNIETIFYPQNHVDRLEIADKFSNNFVDGKNNHSPLVWTAFIANQVTNIYSGEVPEGNKDKHKNGLRKDSSTSDMSNSITIENKML